MDTVTGLDLIAALLELIVYLGLHRFGFFLGLAFDFLCNLRRVHLLAVRALLHLPGLDLLQLRYRSWLYSPVAVISRKEHVLQTRFGGVRLVAGDIDVDLRAIAVS